MTHTIHPVITTGAVPNIDVPAPHSIVADTLEYIKVMRIVPDTMHQRCAVAIPLVPIINDVAMPIVGWKGLKLICIDALPPSLTTFLPLVREIMHETNVQDWCLGIVSPDPHQALLDIAYVHADWYKAPEFPRPQYTAVLGMNTVTVIR